MAGKSISQARLLDVTGWRTVFHFLWDVWACLTFVCTECIKVGPIRKVKHRKWSQQQRESMLIMIWLVLAAQLWIRTSMADSYADSIPLRDNLCSVKSNTNDQAWSSTTPSEHRLFTSQTDSIQITALLITDESKISPQLPTHTHLHKHDMIGGKKQSAQGNGISCDTAPKQQHTKGPYTYT